MNDELKLLYEIADGLKAEKFIKSYRNFSLNYLNKCSPYLSVLKYLNKKPSLRALSFLLYKLNIQKIYPEAQSQLHLIIKNKLASKDLR